MNCILHGDCLQVLPTLPANTFDSLVTDPPASISFMGQAWDGDRGGRRQWVSWLSQVMREALRVLKPGAHGLVWAIPRRSHWTAMALEDAGFEVRDCLCHYFLTGFPKNLSVDKAIDKMLGHEREVIGEICCRDIKGVNGYAPGGEMKPGIHQYTAAASPEAKEWDGWGTHLKPAIEHWWLVRKPLSEKTVAENVLKWGTGALNIGACRIPVFQTKGTWHNDQTAAPGTFAGRDKRLVSNAPVQEPVEGFPGWHGTKAQPHKRMSGFKTAPNRSRQTDLHPDSRYPSHLIVSEAELLGDHSGFFVPPVYCPKASRKERNKGCDDLPVGQLPPGNHGRRINGGTREYGTPPARNVHPTVKPVELMNYFITLLTRPGGSVLDCFAGSFTTGVAAQELGFAFTGIEMEAEYIQIGVRRLSA
jgi:DNA methylase